MQEHTDQKIFQLESKIDNQQILIDHQQELIDLYIKTNSLPQEQLFQNGCVFDAWSYVYLLGASFKDLGNTWGAMIEIKEIRKVDILRSL